MMINTRLESDQSGFFPPRFPPQSSNQERNVKNVKGEEERAKIYLSSI